MEATWQSTFTVSLAGGFHLVFCFTCDQSKKQGSIHFLTGALTEGSHLQFVAVWNSLLLYWLASFKKNWLSFSSVLKV